MKDVSFKVSATGKITVYQGKTRLPDEIPLQAFEDLKPLERKAFRKQVDPVLVKAAWLIFGRKCVPGDIMMLHEHRKVIHQVMHDAPRLMAPIYNFLKGEQLRATPERTIVQRFKKLLRKDGYPMEPGRFTRNYEKVHKKWKECDLVQFWGSRRNATPLTEAGWRYFAKMPLAMMRSTFMQSYTLVEYLSGFNKLAVLHIEGLSASTIEFLLRVNQLGTLSEETFKNVALALKPVHDIEPEILAQQLDVVRDWLREEQREVNSGTTWPTIVGNAVSFALIKTELEKAEVSQFKWTAPIEPFVTGDGLVVLPLTDGAQLLDEGNAMTNCLRNMRHYTTEAMKGKSRVFSIRGAAGRATVEFTRRAVGEPWTLQQAEEAMNQPVTKPELERAVKQLEQKINEVKEWQHAA